MKIENYVIELNEVDMLLESGDMVYIDMVVGKKKEGQGRIRSKSRQNWVKEGGIDSKFFHVMLKSRLGRNVLTVVNSSNGGI